MHKYIELNIAGVILQVY